MAYQSCCTKLVGKVCFLHVGCLSLENLISLELSLRGRSLQEKDLCVHPPSHFPEYIMSLLRPGDAYCCCVYSSIAPL